MRLAWTTGALVKFAFRGGDFPALESLLANPPERAPKTADELKSALRAWLGPPPAKEPASNG